MADNSDFQQAIEEMNALWCMLRTFNNPHAAEIWSHARVTVCYNPTSADGLFEQQPQVNPLQRLEFLKQLESNLQQATFNCKSVQIGKIVKQTIDDVFACKTDLENDIVKNDLFERPTAKMNFVANPQKWSVETTTACTQFMSTYGFKEITRSMHAEERMASEFMLNASKDCAKIVEKHQIDPYLFGLGAQLALECLGNSLGGYASAYGVLALNMAPAKRTTTVGSVFFHEWFHMLDHAAFYAFQTPDVGSPLTEIDAPLRNLHKSLIRMSVNKKSSIDPYNTLIAIVQTLGQERGHPPQTQLQHVKQMKEVFHASQKDRRENLNTFFHTVVLENQSDGDLYPFIDKGIQTFDIMSAALKGFHKYLQKGYSEFYAVSLQMDDNYYHIERKPLKWYQKRKPYYSKPTEILARSAEQFCAKELGWNSIEQLGYPQSHEARRTHELFSQFFKQLARVRLTPSTPTRKLK